MHVVAVILRTLPLQYLCNGSVFLKYSAEDHPKRGYDSRNDKADARPFANLIIMLALRPRVAFRPERGMAEGTFCHVIQHVLPAGGTGHNMLFG